jgi:hypothetical protein
MSEAAAFRSLYRQLLHLSEKLPNAAKRTEAVSLVRDRFREGVAAAAANPGAVDVAKLAADAESRLGFLKMLTPRAAHRTGGAELGSGSARIFYANGEKIDAATAAKDGAAKPRHEKARWSNWHGGNMDPDNVAKHTNLLNRAGFRDNQHAKGFF